MTYFACIGSIFANESHCIQMLQLLRRRLTNSGPVYVLILLLFVGLAFDPGVYVWASTFGPDMINFFQTVTLIGHATWMLVFIACCMVGFYAFSRYFRAHKFADISSDLAQKALFVLVSVAGAGLAASSLKYLIGRARPLHFSELGAYYLSPLSTNAQFASFPSGHSTNIFALAFSLCVLFPAARIPLILIASGVAFSRVAIGAHFLSDIIGGALLSLLFVLWWRQAAEQKNIIPSRHRALKESSAGKELTSSDNALDHT